MPVPRIEPLNADRAETAWRVNELAVADRHPDMCLRIGGTWYCSAVVEFWHGLDEGGGPPTQFAENWFYDSARWAPMRFTPRLPASC